MPTAGSAYSYAYATTGELIAWIIGWDLFLEFALGAAVVARGWSGYVGNLLRPADVAVRRGGDGQRRRRADRRRPDAGRGARHPRVGAGHRRAGDRQGRRSACSSSSPAPGSSRGANLTPFVPPGQPARGRRRARPAADLRLIAGLEPAAFGIGGMLTAAAVVFFAYTGFEAVANLSEETQRPGRDLPLGLLGTLGAGHGALHRRLVRGRRDGRSTPTSTRAPRSPTRSTRSAWAGRRRWSRIAAVAGLTSVILVDLVTVSRIGFAMGRDGLLPPPIAKVSPRTGTPVRMTLRLRRARRWSWPRFVPLGALADLVSIGTLFAFVLVSLAVPVLRRTRPDLQRPFRVPLSPVVPVLSALACLYLMANLSVETWLRFLAWLVLGLVIYVAYGYRHSRVRAADRGPKRRWTRWAPSRRPPPDVGITPRGSPIPFPPPPPSLSPPPPGRDTGTPQSRPMGAPAWTRSSPVTREAVADIPDGATLAVGGFGLCGVPIAADRRAARAGRQRADHDLQQLRGRRPGPGRAALRRPDRAARSARSSAATRSSRGCTCPASWRSS